MPLRPSRSVRSRFQDASGGARLDGWLRDLRFGARSAARNPGFALATVLTLGLAIGATSAIFSLVNAILLRPLPYANADRLVVVESREGPVAAANYLDWRRQSEAFERMGAAESWGPNLTHVSEPEKVQALRLSADILPMLGAKPTLGRVFEPDAETPGREHEVVLSHGLWQRRFAGDPNIVGRTIRLDAESYSVIGVMPPGFEFAPFWVTHAELWAPLALAARSADRQGNSLRVFALLKQAVGLERARSELAALTARLEREYPGTNRGVGVTPLDEKVVGNVRPALLVLLGAVVFVLLIACANVAHLMLVRAAGRSKEMALRLALGATRAGLVRQLLIESLLLALAGGGVGLVLAGLGLEVLVALGPDSLPRLETVGLDGRVLAFTLLISLVAAACFGVIPALRASSVDLNGALEEGGRGATDGQSRNRMRSVLLATEFALALVLLVGAGLMIRSVLALQAKDPGFEPRHTLTLVVSLGASIEAQPERRATFYRELLRRVRGTPGVQSASAINHLPIAGDVWEVPFGIEGHPAPRASEDPSAAYRVILPDYFKTLNIPFLRGRDFAESDRLDAPPVVIINEWLAQRHWPGEDPLGKRLRVADSDSPAWATVVGVVKNVVQRDWTAPPREELYLPYLQNQHYLTSPSSSVAYMTLVLRAPDDPSRLVPSIVDSVKTLSSTVAISGVESMDQVVARATAAPRFNLFLLTTFAAVALLLAAIGIYGVVSFNVAQSIRGIGIRMALGASPGRVVRLIVRQGMSAALAGTALGWLGAWAMTRLMASLIYDVEPHDLTTFVSVTLVLTLVAWAASYFPAARASRIEPVVALKS